MNILLIETEPEGHHISLYLNSIVDKLISHNHKVTILTTKKTKDYPTFSYIKKKKIKILYLNEYTIFNRSNYFTILLNQIILFYIIKKKFDSKNDFDYIYFNTFSVIDKAISIFGPPFKNIKFSGLIPSISFYNKKKIYQFSFYKNLINEFLFKRFIKIKNLDTIFVPDNDFIKYSKQKKINKKINISYDFGFFEDNSRKKLKDRIPAKIKKIFNKDKIFILIYGSIRYEKGVQYLLKGLSLITDNHKINLIIAGKQDSYTNNIINEYKNHNLIKKKLFILNYFIPKNLEHYLFQNCNYVWTGYTKNYTGSSAVFFLSSKYHKPVITSDHGLISFYNKKFKTGFTLEIDNLDKIIKLLKSLLKKSHKIKKNNFLLINQMHNQFKFSENIYKNSFLNN